jgi:hypothetical protein
MLCERLVAAATANPADAMSPERIRLASGLGVEAPPLGQWWLNNARPKFGSVDELAWLRIGASFAVGRPLGSEELDSLALSDTTTVATAVGAAVAPQQGSAMEQRMVTTVLAGHCSDVVSPRTGLVADLTNALAPREFLHLAKLEETNVFARRSAHCDTLRLIHGRRN